MQPISDRSGRGNDKLRVLFEIQDKTQAKALYDMVGLHKQNKLPGSEQWMQIYFLLTEKKFEDYADVAASKFYEEDTKRKEEFEARRKAERESRDANGGGQGFNRDGAQRRDGGERRDGGDRRGPK